MPLMTLEPYIVLYLSYVAHAASELMPAHAYMINII